MRILKEPEERKSEILDTAVKFAEVIAENPRLTVQEKLLHIIMKRPLI